MAESGRAWPSMRKATQRVAFFCIRELVVRTAEGGTMKHRMCKCRGGHGWPRAAEPGPRCRDEGVGVHSDPFKRSDPTKRSEFSKHSDPIKRKSHMTR